jgi:hypothetical protein
MKKIIVVMAAISIAVRLYAQGTVNFSNIGGRPVFDVCTGTNAVAGTTFLVQLYFAPDSAERPIDSSFIPLGRSVGLVAPGYFSGGTRTAPISPPGTFAYFQVRAWESAFGASYEEALASLINGRSGLLGKSNIIRVNTSDPTGIPPEPAASLVAAGLSQITLFGPLSGPCIPEPSVPGLALLGAAVWLALRQRTVDDRRRQKSSTNRVMKKIAVMMATIFTGLHLLAQGTVNFSNIGGPGVTNCLTGQAAEAGTTFNVQLYWAPNGPQPDEGALMPLGAKAGLIAAGLFSAGVRTAPVTPPGTLAWFQVRAWETGYGTSYEEAASNPVQVVPGRLALLGKSNIFRVNTSDPTLVCLPEGPELPANLVAAGLSAIYLSAGEPCPEPSAWGLAFLGAGVWLLLRFRTRS